MGEDRKVEMLMRRVEEGGEFGQNIFIVWNSQINNKNIAKI